MRPARAYLPQNPQHVAHAFDVVHDYVRLGDDLGRALVAADTDAQDLLQRPLFAQGRELAEGVEVRGVVPEEHGPLRSVLLDKGTDGGALVRPDGRTGLDHAPADRDPQPQSLPFRPHSGDSPPPAPPRAARVGEPRRPAAR